MHNATPEQIAAAFTEWERRYREEPTRFITESEKAGLSVDTYGGQCAAYFLTILGDVTKSA